MFRLGYITSKYLYQKMSQTLCCAYVRDMTSMNRGHSVMERVLTLEISNIDKIPIFDTPLVLEFMPYIHFCQKTLLPIEDFYTY